MLLNKIPTIDCVHFEKTVFQYFIFNIPIKEHEEKRSFLLTFSILALTFWFFFRGHAKKRSLKQELILTPSGSDDTTVSNEPPCVLDKLISSHDGIIVEVKTIREQYWKSHIKSFFDRQLLKGEPGKWSQQLDSGCAKLYGILETTNFEVNAKMIRR